MTRFYHANGIKVNSHDFRTTQATNFYNETGDIIATADLLRHSSVKVTQGYIKKTGKKRLQTLENYHQGRKDKRPRLANNTASQ